MKQNNPLFKHIEYLKRRIDWFELLDSEKQLFILDKLFNSFKTNNINKYDNLSDFITLLFIYNGVNDTNAKMLFSNNFDMYMRIDKYIIGIGKDRIETNILYNTYDN